MYRVFNKNKTLPNIRDNLRESQYPHQLPFSEPYPQLQTQEEWEMQMLRFNPIQCALEQGPESASVNEIQLRYNQYEQEGKNVLSR